MATATDVIRDMLEVRDNISALLPGHVELGDRLTKGGQGVVYRGKVNGQEAAIKVYFPGQLFKRIDREVALLGSLKCGSIVGLLWSGEIAIGGEALPVVATTFVAGRGLDVLVRDGPLHADRLGPIAYDIAAAIDAMWSRRVVHRDIKPSNIVITPEGRACLIDLGLARHLDQSPLTAMGVTWGTYGYLSPEQTRAVRQLSCKSDIFSLAVTLVEAALGRHPSNHDQLRLLDMRLHETLPHSFPAWKHRLTLMSMLHPRPTARPLPAAILASLAEFAPATEGG